jgi:hypothetical protein
MMSAALLIALPFGPRRCRILPSRHRRSGDRDRFGTGAGMAGAAGAVAAGRVRLRRPVTRRPIAVAAIVFPATEWMRLLPTRIGQFARLWGR